MLEQNGSVLLDSTLVNDEVDAAGFEQLYSSQTYLYLFAHLHVRNIATNT